jgi:hypothetical protein
MPAIEEPLGVPKVAAPAPLPSLIRVSLFSKDGGDPSSIWVERKIFEADVELVLQFDYPDLKIASGWLVEGVGFKASVASVAGRVLTLGA